MKASLQSIRLKVASPLLSVFLLAGLIIALPQVVSASGETITAGSSATTEVKTATNLTGIQINGSDNSTVPVKLLVTNGTLAMTTTTGLTFTGSPTGSTLYFSGARSDVNAALATLTYTRNTTGTDTLEISLVGSGEVFFSGTSHLYEYVSSTLDWNAARTAAAGRTKYGATGYLATITSQSENDFVSARLAGAGWMGASDSASEGAWKWVTGPETNTQFWQGTGTGGTVGGNYANWNNGEPNDSGGNEDCGQFLAGGTGKWNDLPCSGTTLAGYVVEYGAPGNMPSVAAANVSLTTSDTVAPTVPGTPSTTTPTTAQKPVWSWTASTDAGVGLASPAYGVQWSQSSDFSSGVSSSTSSTNSFTQPSNLADGRWYFRVRASDTAANNSAYSTASSVLIDTTAPSAPDIGSGTTYTTDNTPSIGWGASIDGGVGLANPAYTVQWSQSSSFSSGVSSNTTNSLSFTAPTLADGTWYFRESATDSLSHVSAWSSVVTIVVDTVLPSTPGTPSTGTPTSNKKPAWTWTASTDGGSGLDNPAYHVQWSQSGTFSSGVTSGTSNINSFTQPTNLTDGTWYFRVLAVDRSSNNSSYSLVGSVVIDTTPPGITNVTATSASDNSQTIAWTTDKLSSSQVDYGPTNSYGSTILHDVSTRLSTHGVSLTGLVSCTLYHYRVSSVDALSNTNTGSDNTFITSGCAGAATVVSHTDTTIDATSGGTTSLTHDGKTVSLVVPAQIGGTDADFQIKKIDAGSAFSVIGTPTGLSSAGVVYDIKAMQDSVTPVTSFSSPVSVTMTYSADDIKGFVTGSLVIYRWDDGIGWQKLDNCVINTAQSSITCTTPGFSTFALFGTPAPVVVASSSHATAIAKSTKSSKSSSQLADTADDTTTEQAVTKAKVPSLRADGPAVISQPAKGAGSDSKHLVGLLFLAIAAVLGIWWIIAGRRHHPDDNDQLADK